jgi:hypothetical protein
MAVTYNLDTEVKLTLRSTFTKTLDDGSPISDPYAPTIGNISLSNGTGANKGQVQAHEEVTLASLADTTLDLRALAAGMETKSFDDIKAIVIIVDTVDAGYLLEMGDQAATANKWTACFKDATDVIKVGAGGWNVLSTPVDGWTVDATHKLLKFTNPSGGPVTFRYWIVGEGTVS